MSLQRNKNMQGLGQSFLILGSLLLALNIISTYQAVGFTSRFLRTFFVTYTPDGEQSIWLWAYVWAPIVLIPLGVILWAVGASRQRAESARLRRDGDPMGSGFVGQAPGEQAYNPQFGAAAQASYGPTIAGSVTQPDYEAGPQFGERYNTGTPPSGDQPRA